MNFARLYVSKKTWITEFKKSDCKYIFKYRQNKNNIYHFSSFPSPSSSFFFFSSFFVSLVSVSFYEYKNRYTGWFTFILDNSCSIYCWSTVSPSSFGINLNLPSCNDRAIACLIIPSLSSISSCPIFILLIYLHPESDFHLQVASEHPIVVINSLLFCWPLPLATFAMLEPILGLHLDLCQKGNLLINTVFTWIRRHIRYS